MNTGHEKTTVMGYRTIFEGSDNHHSNTGLHITHYMFVNEFFMVLRDLTADPSASDGHTSLLEDGNIWIELKSDTELKII
jgi:hypothetical protein